MKNIIVTDLHNGFFDLRAEEGYQLVSLLVERVVSEAVVKQSQFKDFKAVPKED